MNDKLKKAIFAAESVAHLQGYEREILPLTDTVREMHKLLENLGVFHLTASFSSDVEELEGKGYLQDLDNYLADGTLPKMVHHSIQPK